MTLRDLLEELQARPTYCLDQHVQLQISPEVYTGIEVQDSEHAVVRLIQGEADCAGYPFDEKDPD